MQTVIETPGCLAEVEDLGLTERERAAAVDAIAAAPQAGDLIPGTGKARKIRFAGRGKGKSGGYRVITYFGGDDVPVSLLRIFSKGGNGSI